LQAASEPEHHKEGKDAIWNQRHELRWGLLRPSLWPSISIPEPLAVSMSSAPQGHAKCWPISGLQWCYACPDDEAVPRGYGNVLILGLGDGYKDMLHLWKFIKCLLFQWINI
jgi:hypothetical protein